MNLFNLAKIELIREHKDPNNLPDLIDMAVEIRHWLDIHQEPSQSRAKTPTGQGIPIYRLYKERKKYYLNEDNLYQNIFERE